MQWSLALVVLISSFTMAFFLIPELIALANKIKLNFIANDQTAFYTGRKISSLGGIAIFVSFRVTNSLFFEIPNFPSNYFIASLFILFLTGLNDDLAGSRPISRLIIQLIAAVIFVFPTNFFLISSNGFLNIEANYPFFSLILSSLFIVGVINSFNLIDGIDGLSGSLGAIGSIIFSFLFYLNDDIGLSLLSLSLFGSLMAFLYFNVSPANIFIGDSGAYIIGFTFSVFSIKLINEVSLFSFQIANVTITSAYSIVSAIIMVPVFDAVRVFLLRLYRKSNPFKGDFSHIHHRLLKIGFSHYQIMLTLSLLTLFLFILSILLQPLGPILSIAILFANMIIFNLVIYLFELRHKSISDLTMIDFEKY